MQILILNKKFQEAANFMHKKEEKILNTLEKGKVNVEVKSNQIIII